MSINVKTAFVVAAGAGALWWFYGRNRAIIIDGQSAEFVGDPARCSCTKFTRYSDGRQESESVPVANCRQDYSADELASCSGAQNFYQNLAPLGLDG